MEPLVVAIVVIALGIVFAKVWLKGTKQAGAYTARPLMTENEAEFFGRLVVALPDHYIFPQVAMSALIQPASSDKKKAHSDRLRIAQQRVDYAVCDKACRLVAVVELDDRTHSADKDRMRDQRLHQAGIRTVRIQSKNKPSADHLRNAILPAPTVQKAPQPSVRASEERIGYK